VVVSPLPLAAILDHHLRRGNDQDRVFGTLLGVRSEADNTVQVRNAFGVPYQAQGRGEVTVDMDHHKSLLDLHLKINPNEVVVGWYVSFFSPLCATAVAVAVPELKSSTPSVRSLASFVSLLSLALSPLCHL
jgi:hypothetical protein